VKFPRGVIILVALALVVVLAEPFVAYGDAQRPGLGEILNGGIALALLVAALVWALVIRRRG
jgi:uncharacterized protein (TIGR03382 family)